MLTSLYIHIPFCEHICTYCDFHKEKATNQKQENYVHALIKELKYREKDLVNINTIYIGGGTPMSLSIPLLTTLLSAIKSTINVQHVQEYTIESNPNNITVEKVDLLLKYGINRISIGVQTFNEKQLTFLNRDHTLADVTNGIHLLQSMKFPNISVDMMFSLIDQTVEELETDIEHVLKLHVDHISYYSLILEEKTTLYYLYQKGQIDLNSEDIEGLMYNIVIDKLTKHGYNQYEISNFARPHKESLHNKTYWEYRDYLGIGSGAHSFVDGIRYFHNPSVAHYISKINNGDFTPDDTYNNDGIGDELMLGLRLNKGICIAEINNRYHADIFVLYPDLEDYIKNGLLDITDGYLHFTRKGMLLGNIVFSTFVEVK